ncbi:hypothetical protein CAC42_7469 [Sphaceloma murrayae]|uniref:Uncharacterized protein n=1 Tax=Sphaceloma murrayae TaxID=2082308 RepID=A0A2K1QX40_9PEZI|nr:hypothetical protein CAC42_7469 [Sphaceloma murrayae]
MPVEAAVVLSQFCIGLCIVCSTHILRSARREIEDFYDYRRLCRGKAINGQRQRERCRLIRRKMRKAKRYGKPKYTIAKFKPSRHDEPIFWDVDGASGAPPNWRAMRRGHVAGLKSHRLDGQEKKDRRMKGSKRIPRRERILATHPYGAGSKEKKRRGEEKGMKGEKGWERESVVPTLDVCDEGRESKVSKPPPRKTPSRSKSDPGSAGTSFSVLSGDPERLGENQMMPDSCGMSRKSRSRSVNDGGQARGSNPYLGWTTVDHEQPKRDQTKASSTIKPCQTHKQYEPSLDSDPRSSQTSPPTTRSRRSGLLIFRYIPKHFERFPFLNKKHAKPFKAMQKRRRKPLPERARDYIRESWKKVYEEDDSGYVLGYWGFRRGYSATHYDPTHTHGGTSGAAPSAVSASNR